LGNHPARPARAVPLHPLPDHNLWWQHLGSVQGHGFIPAGFVYLTSKFSNRQTALERSVVFMLLGSVMLVSVTNSPI
jgi:hypothetical protein